MTIPYQIAKFNFINIFTMPIWGPTTKLNFHKHKHHVKYYNSEVFRGKANQVN